MISKISKRLLSLVVLVVFSLSLIPTISMAATPDYYTANDPAPWVGTNVPRAKMVSANGNSVNAEGNATASNDLKAIMEYNETGVYGKVASDASYYTYDYSERTTDGMVLNSFNNFFFSYAPTMVDGVHEFSFAYKTPGANNNIIRSRYRLGTNASTGKGYEEKELFVIKTNSISYAGSEVPYNFESGKWYTITLVYDMGGRNYKAYVNGVPTVDATYTKTYYGLGQAQIGPALNAEVYWDNINMYNTDDVGTFKVSDATQADLKSSVEGIAVNGNVITAADSATVADVKNAVNASLRANDVIRFYNSDYSELLDDTALVKNANVVVASTRDYSDSLKNVESTYTYYTVDRFVYEFTGVNDGSSLPTISGKNNPDTCELTIESDGIGGKIKSEDNYIKYEVGSANKYANFFGTGAVKAYEFSLYMPSDSVAALAFAIGFHGDETGTDGKNYASYTFRFFTDGIERNNLKFADMPLDQWVNFAIVPPVGGGDNDYEFYMNGVKLRQETLINEIVSNGSVRHARFAGTTVNNQCTLVYLDNIRSSTTVDYIPGYDAEVPVTMSENGISFNDKTISVVSADAKVADVVADLSIPEDAKVRVFNAIGEAVADNNVAIADGYKIVVVATNGSAMERAYSYYTVRIVTGKIAFDKPYITLNAETGAVTGNVNVYNYTGSSAKYNVYLAIYSGSELIELIPAPLTADVGKATSVSPSYSLQATEEAKLFVWSEDGISPELKYVRVVR